MRGDGQGGLPSLSIIGTSPSGKFYRLVPESALPRWDEEFPDRSDLLCWHCCHPFDTRPLPLPVAYDERHDVFRCHGVFCSFGCAKAYGGFAPRDPKVVALFEKRLRRDGGAGAAARAPARHLLRAFGGHMDIAEFRGRRTDLETEIAAPPAVIVHTEVYHETPAFSRRGRRRARRDDAGPVGGPDAGIDALTLKRARHATKSTMLERTLGLAPR